MSTEFGATGYTPPPPPRDQRVTESVNGIGATLGGLLRDLQDMVRGEIALARAELREDASGISRGVMALGAAVFLGLTGFIFLMLGATYLLNIWMRMWIAAAIVGGVLLFVAAVAGISGKNRLRASNLKPDRTIASVKENTEWAKQQINSVNR
jgi:uncharacterized membrane protein YqjE